VRVGVIGTNWGRMHIGAFRGAGADVVALCGRDAEKTRRIAAEERIELATASVDELIDACEVVVVASPDRDHFWHVGEAVAAGRHVLCEKPLAFNSEEAAALARLDGPGVRAVCFPYRFLPPMAALKRWLAGRAPMSLTVTVRNSFAAMPGREASGDLGGCSHLLDAALWLMSAEPRSVRRTTSGEPPHSATFVLELEGGAHASVSQLAVDEPGIRGEWLLSGDGWHAQVAGGYEPSLGGWKFGPARVLEREWVELAPAVSPGESPEPWARAHVETARAFLGAIAGGRFEPLASFTDAAQVSLLLREKVARSAG